MEYGGVCMDMDDDFIIWEWGMGEGGCERI